MKSRGRTSRSESQTLLYQGRKTVESMTNLLSFFLSLSHRILLFCSKFNLAFREAAVKAHAQVKHDGFDTEVIEVGKNDVTKFLETLHSIIGKFH